MEGGVSYNIMCRGFLALLGCACAIYDHVPTRLSLDFIQFIINIMAIQHAVSWIQMTAMLVGDQKKDFFKISVLPKNSA